MACRHGNGKSLHRPHHIAQATCIGFLGHHPRPYGLSRPHHEAWSPSLPFQLNMLQ